MNNHCRPWTCAEQRRLRRMADAGMSNKKIAEALGRSRTAVCHRRWEMRVGYPVGSLRGVCTGSAPRSARIVEALTAAEGPMSPDDLAVAVYGQATLNAKRTLRVHIHNLRREGLQVATVDRRYVLGEAA